MTCNSDCQNSRHNRCRCSCGGAKHGIKLPENSKQHEQEELMSINDGGEIQVACEKLQGQSYQCFCGDMVPCLPLYGYPHDGGEADKNGNKFWLYQKCSKCQYAMALWKIMKKLMVVA